MPPLSFEVSYTALQLGAAPANCRPHQILSRVDAPAVYGQSVPPFWLASLWPGEGRHSCVIAPACYGICTVAYSALEWPTTYCYLLLPPTANTYTPPTPCRGKSPRSCHYGGSEPGAARIANAGWETTESWHISSALKFYQNISECRYLYKYQPT